MTTESNIALALPEESTFRNQIAAINKFQQVVHQTMVKDLDYGIIPGTQKPTLLKPGAEKIAKLLGLSDQYEIMSNSEEWDKPFFRYLIKCKLVHINTGFVVSEGLGECNSYESKYRWRWVSERDLPPGTDKSKLVSQVRTSKTGGKWTVYRFENDEVFSQVNTILKMAKKRALVDAALSAGRLSDVFTQDMEDLPRDEVTEVLTPKAEIKPTEAKPEPKQEQQASALGTQPGPTPADAAKMQEFINKNETKKFDFDTLKKQLAKLKWKDTTFGTFLYRFEIFANLDVSGTAEQITGRMSPEQQETLAKLMLEQVAKVKETV